MLDATPAPASHLLRRSAAHLLWGATIGMEVATAVAMIDPSLWLRLPLFSAPLLVPIAYLVTLLPARFFGCSRAVRTVLGASLVAWLSPILLTPLGALLAARFGSTDPTPWLSLAATIALGCAATALSWPAAIRSQMDAPEPAKPGWTALLWVAAAAMAASSAVFALLWQDVAPAPYLMPAGASPDAGGSPFSAILRAYIAGSVLLVGLNITGWLLSVRLKSWRRTARWVLGFSLLGWLNPIVMGQPSLGAARPVLDMLPREPGPAVGCLYLACAAAIALVALRSGDRPRAEA